MLRFLSLIIFLVASLSAGIGLGQERLPADATEFVALENRTLGEIYDVEFTPDSQTLIISAAGGLYRYDVATFTRQATLTMEAVRDFDLSPDGEQIVYSKDGKIHIVNALTGELIQEIAPTSADPDAVVTYPTFAPDNVTIAAVALGGWKDVTITIWESGNGGQTYQSRTFILEVNLDSGFEPRLTWTLDGTHLMVLPTLFLVVVRVSDFHISYENNGFVHEALLSPDGRQLLVSQHDSVILIDTQTWQIEQVWQANEWADLVGWIIAWNPLNNMVIARLASTDSWGLLDINTGQAQFLPILPYKGDLEKILKWSPNGKNLITVTRNSVLRIVDAVNWQIKHEEITKIGHHLGYATWSNDGTIIQTAAQIWDTETLALRISLADQRENYQWVSSQLSPSGAYVARINDTELYIIDAQTGELIDSTSFTGAIKWSPNSRHLAVLSQESITFITIENGEILSSQLETLPPLDGYRTDLYWSSDGNYLVINGRMMEVFAVQSQGDELNLQLLWQIYGEYFPEGWSFDEETMAVFYFDIAEREGYLQLRNTVDGTVLASELIPNAAEYIDYTVAAWSPNSDYIAFGHEWGTITIWLVGRDGDRIIFEKVRTLEKHMSVSIGTGGATGSVLGLHWVSETELHSLGADGVLRVWGIPDEE